MVIDLVESTEQRLSALAQASGFECVEDFIAVHLTQLAQAAVEENASTSSDEELRAWARECDGGMADVNAGKTLSLEEARLRAQQVRAHDAE